MSGPTDTFGRERASDDEGEHEPPLTPDEQQEFYEWYMNYMASEPKPRWGGE